MSDRCPHCNGPWRPLTAAQTAACLLPAQRLEARLPEAVWTARRCDACALTDLTTSLPPEPCPRCGRLTVVCESAALTEPSVAREGRERLALACRAPGCGYRDAIDQPLPALTPPPPDAPGAFGAATTRGAGAGASF
jgi:hypothetical protein